MRIMQDVGNISIPVGWTYQKIKTLVTGLTDGTHGTYERLGEGFPLLSAKNVFEDGIHISKNESLISENDYKSITANGFPHRGDVLLCCVGTIGRTTIYKEDQPMAFQRSVIFITPNNDVITSEWLNYTLMNPDVIAQEECMVNQAAQPGLYQGSVRQIKIPVPPLSEQHAIVSFLDRKCVAIDDSIAKHKAIIEKLEEYRKAEITRAVTKGLNPDAKMKDSGIESIGFIPEQWRCVRLKFLLENGANGIKIGPFGSALKDKTLESGPYKIYNQANVIADDFSLKRHFISEDTFQELQNYLILPGDVLFSMMGTIGKCSIMPKGIQAGIMDSHLLKAQLSKRIDTSYFKYVYDKDNSNAVIQQLMVASKGSIMNGLNSSILKNVFIPLPSIKEQKQIVAFLNKTASCIDDDIDQHNQLIAKLEEYKKSLIYNAVTGKIDCREGA